MTEQEFYEDLFGRGPGDPDVYGYPGEPKDETLTTTGLVEIDDGPINLTDIPF